VQKVILSGKWGSNESTVYLPDKEIVDGAIVLAFRDPREYRSVLPQC